MQKRNVYKTITKKRGNETCNFQKKGNWTWTECGPLCNLEFTFSLLLLFIHFPLPPSFSPCSTVFASWCLETQDNIIPVRSNNTSLIILCVSTQLWRVSGNHPSVRAVSISRYNYQWPISGPSPCGSRLITVRGPTVTGTVTINFSKHWLGSRTICQVSGRI